MNETSVPGVYTHIPKDRACSLSGIHEGVLVTIDTNLSPSNNSLVCIKHDDKFCIRRILYLDSTHIYVPDDPHFAIIESDVAELVGLVINFAIIESDVAELVGLVINPSN